MAVEMQKPNVEFYLSKKKNITLGIISAVYISLMGYLIFKSSEFSILMPLIIIILLAYTLLFLVPILFRGMKLILQKKPILILSDEQLIDNFNRITFKWTDIDHIYYKKNIGPRTIGGHITLELIRPVAFLQLPRPIERWKMKLSNKKLEFIILSDALNRPSKEVLAKLQYYHKNRA
jgi:hypothetical protein